MHASWLNQISVIQRKLLTPDDFADLDILASQILAFEQHYNAAATPFGWKFTRTDLNRLLTRLARHDPATPRPPGSMTIHELTGPTTRQVAGLRQPSS